MGELCPPTLQNFLIRFYVCLSFIWTFAESDVGLSKDCGMGFAGSTYMGTRNVTLNEKVCQAWTSDSPHKVSGDIEDHQFPDESRAEAQNFCRNPQPNEKNGTWCYTVDSNVEWEYCDPCPENYGNYRGCTLADKGASYTGTLDRTMSHLICEPWSSHPNSGFVFSDGNEQKAKNYCRNPLPVTYLAPWCYIKAIGSIDWDYCDICKPFQGEVNQVIGSYSSTFIKTSKMNGTSCIGWCITYLSCAGVIIKSNGGKSCLYFTTSGGDTVSDASWNQYNVSRSCGPRTQGAAAYFISGPARRGLKAESEEKMSSAECNERCIANVSCLMVDYYTKLGTCKMSASDTDTYEAMENVTEKYIVRCNRSMPADLSSSKTINANGTNQTASAPLSEEPSATELKSPSKSNISESTNDTESKWNLSSNESTTPASESTKKLHKVKEESGSDLSSEEPTTATAASEPTLKSHNVKAAKIPEESESDLSSKEPTTPASEPTKESHKVKEGELENPDSYASLEHQEHAAQNVSGTNDSKPPETQGSWSMDESQQHHLPVPEEASKQTSLLNNTTSKNHNATTTGVDERSSNTMLYVAIAVFVIGSSIGIGCCILVYVKRKRKKHSAAAKGKGEKDHLLDKKHEKKPEDSKKKEGEKSTATENKLNLQAIKKDDASELSASSKSSASASGSSNTTAISASSAAAGVAKPAHESANSNVSNATMGVDEIEREKPNITLYVGIVLLVVVGIMIAIGRVILYKKQKRRAALEEVANERKKLLRKKSIDQNAAKRQAELERKLSQMTTTTLAAAHNQIDRQNNQLSPGAPAVPLQTMKSTSGGTAQITKSTPNASTQIPDSIPAQPAQIIQSAPGGTAQITKSTPKAPTQTLDSIPAQPAQIIQSAPGGTTQITKSTPNAPTQIPDSIAAQPAQIIKSSPT